MNDLTPEVLRKAPVGIGILKYFSSTWMNERLADILGFPTGEKNEHRSVFHIFPFSILDISCRKNYEYERLEKEKLHGLMETGGAAWDELNQPLDVVVGYAELAMMDSLHKTPCPEMSIR